MKTKDLVAAAGTQRELARILGLTPQAVNQWGATVPQLQQYRIRELRPGWFRRGGRMGTKR